MVELDSSELSIKDNDRKKLVEHLDEHITEVTAPYFGWDEPGALLETFADEKELFNPSTIGMTLAIAGRDLLEN